MPFNDTDFISRGFSPSFAGSCFSKMPHFHPTTVKSGACAGKVARDRCRALFMRGWGLSLPRGENALAASSLSSVDGR